MLLITKNELDIQRLLNYPVHQSDNTAVQARIKIRPRVLLSFAES